VSRVSDNIYKNSYELSPMMVHGSKEVFRDVGAMVKTWEEMEGDINEWRQEGGVRRGGRRISRRISDMLRSFEEQEGEDIDRGVEISTGPESNPIVRGEDILFISDISERNFGQGGQGVLPQEQFSNVGIKLQNNESDVDVKQVGNWNMKKSKACDWLTHEILTANSVRGRKRKRESDDNCVFGTKRKCGQVIQLCSGANNINK
jgi:hypothetical protein